VNIFAIDPVAGLGANHDHDACNVYGNVKAFVSIISLGEDRWAFTPMHEQTYLKIHNKEVTKYVPLHMPGVHDTIAKYNNSAGKLAFHLCYRFLKDRGTSMGITDMFAMSDANCLQHYGLLLAKRGGTFGTHAKKKSLFGISYGGSLSKPEKGVPTGQGRWKAYTTGGGYQSRPVELNDFVSSKAIFFNVHHEALFEAQCPAINHNLNLLELQKQSLDVSRLVAILDGLCNNKLCVHPQSILHCTNLATYELRLLKHLGFPFV
jgi:hypothetical protein